MMKYEGYKNYIGAKIIKAKLTDLRAYKLEKYGDSAQVNQDDETIFGYMVIYPPLGKSQTNPYLSWSPKDVFEKAYREIENCEISLTLD